MMFAPLEGWRHVKVTERRTAIDYAHALKDLADVHFPDSKTIVLVQHNLNAHTPASLYEAFPVPEARRLAERFEWHYSEWRRPNFRGSSPARYQSIFVRRRRPRAGRCYCRAKQLAMF